MSSTEPAPALLPGADFPASPRSLASTDAPSTPAHRCRAFSKEPWSTTYDAPRSPTSTGSDCYPWNTVKTAGLSAQTTCPSSPSIIEGVASAPDNVIEGLSSAPGILEGLSSAASAPSGIEGLASAPGPTTFVSSAGVGCSPSDESSLSDGVLIQRLHNILGKSPEAEAHLSAEELQLLRALRHVVGHHYPLPSPAAAQVGRVSLVVPERASNLLPMPATSPTHRDFRPMAAPQSHPQAWVGMAPSMGSSVRSVSRCASASTNPPLPTTVTTVQALQPCRGGQVVPYQSAHAISRNSVPCRRYITTEVHTTVTRTMYEVR